MNQGSDGGYPMQGMPPQGQFPVYPGTPPHGTGGAPPSKVLHIRGLPDGASEYEVSALAAQAGQIVNVFVLHGKRQAFVEYPTVEAAANALAFLRSTPQMLQGRPCYFDFSRRTEIMHPNSPSMPPEEIGAPSRILHLQFSNPIFPIMIEHIHAVCSRHGNVLRVVLFEKAGLKALVEFGTLDEATRAVRNIDCFEGTPTKILCKYSSLESLHVSFNNDKSRDFTRPWLPASAGAPPGSPAVALGHSMAPGTPGVIPQTPPSFVGTPGAAMGMSPVSAVLAAQYNLPVHAAQPRNSPVVIVDGLAEEFVTIPLLFNLFEVYGNVLEIKFMHSKPDTALIRYENPYFASQAVANLNGMSFFGKKLRVNFSKHGGITAPPRQPAPGAKAMYADFSTSKHRYNASSKDVLAMPAPASTLHLMNIQTLSDTDVMQLFEKFEPGARFSRFETNANMGLVELSSIDVAAQALAALHWTRTASGHLLRVSFARARIQGDRNAMGVE